MPARKPKALITRHETAAEQRERESREAAMRPEQGLPMAPARLEGHAVAAATWRRLIRLYGEIEGEIITRLDMDLLIDYCMLSEQLAEMDKMRASVVAAWQKMMDDKADPEAVMSAVDTAVKLDGRIDRKRALLFQMRQSLYMTPRARAGVAPAKREEPEEPTDMDQLLAEANELIGNGK